MLIDGKLVEAASGATYDNINPATEEVIGQVADGGADDMERAIDAARRAFDETDWSTEPRAPQARACSSSRTRSTGTGRTLRPQIVAEVGTPIMLTYAVQQDSLHRRHAVGHRPHRPLRVGVRPAGPRVHGHAQRPAGRPRADRRRRRDHAVELPVHAEPVEDRARARGRQHRGAEARARHAVERDVHRQASPPRRPTSRRAC